ncbi:MAG: phage Gp37/Gp68 family protein [Hyphomicrobiales bacterium]|nr:phage Gp37/Gp68 family protein [Hyphomicrobiales bacterium]
MGDKSAIEWTDATWNPIVGCSVVSPGCTNCYAMKMAYRIRAASEVKDGASHYCGTIRLHENGMPIWTGKVALGPDHILTAPLRWKRPRKIFVNSMGDLFHESIPDEWIDRVFAVMALAPQHTFQVLTKRSTRMRAYLTANGLVDSVCAQLLAIEEAHESHKDDWTHRVGVDAFATRFNLENGYPNPSWPLPNVWLGVSAEDQRRADERIPDLLATPAAVRFVSAEPLLGPIDFTSPLYIGEGGITMRGYLRNRGEADDFHFHAAKLDQVILGGESGPGARYCWVPRVRAIVKQCLAAGTAVYVKQLGADIRDRNDAGFDGCEPDGWPDMDPDAIEHDLDGTRDGYQGAPVRVHLRDRKGGDMDEWPEDLRVRQFPMSP